jgi:ubiquitin-conjugating enzyme E2 H
MREAAAYEARVKEYVNKYATKEAADGISPLSFFKIHIASTDAPDDDDEMSSLGDFSDDEAAGNMEL